MLEVLCQFQNFSHVCADQLNQWVQQSQVRITRLHRYYNRKWYRGCRYAFSTHSTNCNKGLLHNLFTHVSVMRGWIRGLRFKKYRFKGATSRFEHLEKFSLNFSSLSFAIHVNLLYPKPSLLLFGLFLPLCCLSTLTNYYFYIQKNFLRREKRLKIS